MLYAPQGMIQELITASREGNLARVDELLQIPAVRDNAAAHNSWALGWAAEGGHLDVVNRLLEIPVVSDNAAASSNWALRAAAEKGHINVVNRLLEIPAVRDNASVDDNLVLVHAAVFGHLDVVNRLLEIPAVIANAAAHNNYAFQLATRNGCLDVVNRLLEIPAVRANAAADNNYAFRLAAENDHLDVVNRLLEIPDVRAPLENGSRENFLNFLKRRLQNIKENASLTFELNENGKVVSTTSERGPLDAEIDIVDILRDIGRRHGISPTDFTQEELAILTFARRVNDSLHFKLSTNTTLMARLLAAPAPQLEPLPLFDPAAPASSSGVPVLTDDASFCSSGQESISNELSPDEPSSFEITKRARLR